ncbi:glycosyltransferase [Pseudomonas sp. ISL-84]|nr:glycosyltransferase [Pseudomonas sp. ISL-84]
MNPKVSIIVPIYNVEKYLSRCLDSLLSQELVDIEVIAVNDGSTDSSKEIINEYKNRDKRIKTIHKKNGGVSSARNKGLEIAQGEYIGFVDPDDWIDNDMYKTLYHVAFQEKADIVMCTYTREFGTHSKEKKFELPEKIRYTGTEVQSKIMRRLIGPLDNELANPELLDAWGTVWSKIYRAEIIKNLRFTDLKEIGTNEDSLFNIEALYYSKSFIFINKPFYHYWRENNASVTSSYKPDLVIQWENLYKKMKTFIESEKMDEEYITALNNRICMGTLGLGLNTISADNPANSLEKIKRIKIILNNKQIISSFKQLDLSSFPVVWRAFYFCAKTRSALGVYLMLNGINFLRRAIR